MPNRKRRVQKKKERKSLQDVYEEWYDSQEKEFKKVKDCTHECPYCGRLEVIDDHHAHAPYWCDRCDSIRTFRKV